MRILITTLSMCCLLLSTVNVYAQTDLYFMKQGMSYIDAKKMLIEKGWSPIKNKNISNSSLYAQDIYLQGLEEVVDCISMELDACTFRFVQKHQVLEVKTITRSLKVESYKNDRKR